MLSRADKYNTKIGCDVNDPCDTDPCPLLTSVCTSQFGEYKCSCNWGEFESSITVYKCVICYQLSVFLKHSYNLHTTVKSVVSLSGRKGTSCDRICDRYNPCKNNARCRQLASSPTGYICECPTNFEGVYCEQQTNMPCPSGWWGSPICGPCNCPEERGFDAKCDKQTGVCSCRVSCISRYTDFKNAK